MFNYDVSTPPDWSERRPENRREDPKNGEVLAQWDRAGTDDTVTLFKDPKAEEDPFSIEWMKDDGLAHAHGAATEDEWKGAISAITHMINHCDGSGFDPSEYDGILEEREWGTPRTLHVENGGPLTIAVERDPHELQLFEKDDGHTIEPGAHLWNSWDGELYRVVDVGDETVVLDVINAEKSIEVSLEWAELTLGDHAAHLNLDQDRIHLMERM